MGRASAACWERTLGPQVIGLAIYHLSMKPMSRSSGRSAVAAAAYRSGQKLTNERDGLTHDFTRKGGIAHSEIVTPEGSNSEWAKDRSRLWNAAEHSEKRKDARVAREIEIALPHELTVDQRLALTREFSQGLADRFGVAVDFSIHTPDSKTDERNHHAHIMMTTRKVEASGLGEKSTLELENKKLIALGLPTSHDQLRDIRLDWEERANRHLALAGHDIRIDHRSHVACGIDLEPTQHVGVHACQMDRRGKPVDRRRQDEDGARRNAKLIREKPEQVFALITNEKSVFDRYDVARTLHRYIENPEDFQAAYAKAMASPALVELQPERPGKDRAVEPARYSTKEMIAVERDMANSADRMAEGRSFAVAGRRVEGAIAARAYLAQEQREAVRHVTGPERISAVVGLAGAGKSTMLAAAREAWEAQGYRVQGAALAGKAAEGLEESSGIPSRTLASWERGWERGYDRLSSKDVFVIDEAGMVGSRQLSRFVIEAERAGAKIVLVGDPEQLQPIGPGAAFRAVSERVGFAELGEIRRQGQDWQRAASIDFGRHRTHEGLTSYAERGAIRFEDHVGAARAAIVRDVMGDMDARPDGSRLVLAHRRVDVTELNQAIRAARQERGELAGEKLYQTAEGERAFATGDRLLFRENNRSLGVKNGMLGMVEKAEDGRLEIRLDTAKGPGQGRSVSVSMADYAAVDHGYATTIHKAQGATVDRTYVLASGSMDRHLTYVGMTRHRDSVTLYAGQDEFKDVAALSSRLSRSQLKETTLDYPKAYAERRGLDRESAAQPRASAPEPARAAAPEQKQRGMFDGLRLGSGKPPDREVMSREVTPTLDRAAENYARDWTDADRMVTQGLPILEHQKLALRQSGNAMEAARPGATQDLQEAMRYDASAQRAMKELSGPERGEALARAITKEAQVRHDPQARGERLVKEWNGLEKQRDRLGSGLQDKGAHAQIESRMKAIAGSLKRDPQLESLMRNRAKQLGIGSGSTLSRVIQAPSIESAIGQIARGRDRGMSL
jgi:Ti-type conjugative transfer relaxase TraA